MTAIHSVAVTTRDLDDLVDVAWCTSSGIKVFRSKFLVPPGEGRAVASLLLPDDGKTVCERGEAGAYRRWVELATVSVLPNGDLGQWPAKGGSDG